MPALIDNDNPYPLYASFPPSAASSPRVTSTGVPARSVGGQMFAPPTSLNNTNLVDGGIQSTNRGSKLILYALMGMSAYFIVRSL